MTRTIYKLASLVVVFFLLFSYVSLCVEGAGETPQVISQDDNTEMYYKAQQKTNLTVYTLGSSDVSNDINNVLNDKVKSYSAIRSVSDLTTLDYGCNVILIDGKWIDNIDNASMESLKINLKNPMDKGIPIVIAGGHTNILTNDAQNTEIGADGSFTTIASMIGTNPVTGASYARDFCGPMVGISNLNEGIKYALTWADLFIKDVKMDIISNSSVVYTDSTAQWVLTSYYTVTWQDWPYGIVEKHSWCYQNSLDGSSTYNFYVIKYKIVITPGKLLIQCGINGPNGQPYDDWKTDDAYLDNDIDVNHQYNGLQIDTDGDYYKPLTASGTTNGIWNFAIGIGIQGIGAEVGWSQGYEDKFGVQFQGVTTNGNDYVRWWYTINTESYGSLECYITGGMNVKCQKYSSNPNGAFYDDPFLYGVLWHNNRVWYTEHHWTTYQFNGQYSVLYP